MPRIAVVTGSNKGIGYATVKLLASKFDGIVYLTARNENLGIKAVQELEMFENNVKFHQLDITDAESISRFAIYLKRKHNGLDVLINNAAILIKPSEPVKFDIRATEVIKVNFTSTLNLCNALYPLLRPHARVVNVASKAGLLRLVRDRAIKQRLLSDNLTIEELNRIMGDYVKSARKNPNHPIIASIDEITNSIGNYKYFDAQDKRGVVLPNAYSMSKVGLIALTRLQQREFNKDKREDLIVSSMCPGYVSTDMTAHKGYLAPEEGAQTPVFLATLPKNFSGAKGAFWSEKKVFDWTDLEWNFSR